MNDRGYQRRELLSKALTEAVELLGVDLAKLRQQLREAFQDGSIQVIGDMFSREKGDWVRNAAVPPEYFRDQVDPGPSELKCLFPQEWGGLVEVRDACDPAPWPGETKKQAQMRAIDERMYLQRDQEDPTWDGAPPWVALPNYSQDPESIPVKPNERRLVKMPDGSEQPSAGQRFFATAKTLAMGRPDWEKNRCVDLAFMAAEELVPASHERTRCSRFAEELRVSRQAIDEYIAAHRSELGIPPVVERLPTGTPGRPSLASHARKKMEERAGEGSMKSELKSECTFLTEWLRREFPDQSIPTEKSLANALRDDYRKFKRTPNDPSMK